MPRRVVPIWSLPSFASPAWSRQHVVRHDQVRVGADPQAGEVDALGAQLVQLAGQHLRVDHDAVADRAQLARVEDPGRDQVELPVHAVAHDGVPGVVAALEADHEVRLLREEVDDLAFALVAPLGAHDHDSGHVVEMSLRRSRAVAAARSAGCRPPSGRRRTGPACCAAATGDGDVELVLQAAVVAEHRQRVAAHLVQPRDRPVADLAAQLGVRARVPLVVGDVRGPPALLIRFVVRISERRSS